MRPWLSVFYNLQLKLVFGYTNILLKPRGYSILYILANASMSPLQHTNNAY
jgi:hypothetical protein